MAKFIEDRKLCIECKKRPALYIQPNRKTLVLKFAKDHPLCNRCFRSIKESLYQVAVNG